MNLDNVTHGELEDIVKGMVGDEPAIFTGALKTVSEGPDGQHILGLFITDVENDRLELVKLLRSFAQHYSPLAQMLYDGLPASVDRKKLLAAFKLCERDFQHGIAGIQSVLDVLNNQPAAQPPCTCPDAPVESAHWETAGGTTPEQNEARFAAPTDPPTSSCS